MKRSIQRKVNSMTLRNKLIAAFILVVFVPVLIVGIFLTSELQQMALDNAVDDASSDMTRIKARLTEALVPSVYVSNSLFVDQRLKEVAETTYETTYDVVEAYKNYTYLEDQVRYYPEIENIRLYVQNETMLNNWRFIPVKETSEIVQTSWYQDALKHNGLMNWSTIQSTEDHSDAFSVSRVIHFAGTQTHAVLVINVNTAYLNTIINQEALPILFLDSSNHIVATNQSGLLGKNLEQVTISPKLKNGELGIFQDQVFNAPSHILVDELTIPNSVNGFRIVSIIPDAAIMEGANRLRNVGLAVIAGSIVIALFLIIWVSTLISKRISMLSRQIQKVGAGDLTTRFSIDGQDEIGQLSRQFNRMTINVQQLLKEIEEKKEEKHVLEKRQNEMKLKMLASQINPHFLFNTLETIRMRVLLKGERETAHIVKRLGRLLRISLEVGGGLVPLKQEIDMVKAYLEIQHFRFEDRLTYELNIDPATEDFLIPPLVIQPLVENAVIHGLEGKPEGGLIQVETKITGKNLVIQVRDNGIGMSEEQYKKTIRALTASTTAEDRIGLRNVHERILLTFNDTTGLQIETELGAGTVVSMTIFHGE
ncbi:two-component system sensor histidine kinase YesM [Alkalihalobacillus xiaoxiensis]|uniref:Two-component system sensor histidine kinase YesM n=1 Tax=Shouchella xiaoxiensis TaxID=766895 RepID=A0ABS2SP15_9BACI|nr:histidine kinase [Shouchella xiaoxiensis]MBM7837262.1 two-component system sensor histidine kinase YesM [Shouchella xiaoxiensis]